MKRCPVFKKYAAVMVFALIAIGTPVAAQPPEDSNYNPYTQQLAENKDRNKSLLEKSLEFPAWPFDLMRKFIFDPTLYFIDRYRVYDKGKWLYHQFTYRGVYPKLEDMDTFGQSGPKVDFDFMKMAKLKERFPQLRALGGLGWVPGHIGRVAAELGIDKAQEVGPYGSFFFTHENRPNEDFFGLGPDTSRGDGVTYKSEATTLELRGGYSLTLHTDLRFKFAYKTVDIRNGEYNGKGNLDKIFPPQGSIPGAGGADFLIYGTELMHDTRDSIEDPHHGGYERAQLSYWDGIDRFDYSFFKYRGEVTRYQQIFSDRQVLAVRFLGEHNDEVNHRKVPFFEMARLGGNGAYPSLGDTHRGFQRSRFYGDSSLLMNLEYRYMVYQYRRVSVDAVIFWDEGQVFDEFSSFQFKDFRHSVGGGFWYKFQRRPILSLEIARSNEGVQLYAATHVPF